MVYHNLVLEGGGVKGIAYAGAIKALHEKGALKDIKAISGASAGAIASLALACGYHVFEFQKLITEMNFSYFRDDSIGMVRDLYRLFTKYGIYKGDVLTSFIVSILEDVGLDEKTTFKDLQYLAANVKSERVYRELFVTATNISKKRLEVFSAYTTPLMPVAMAVRMSSNIPLFWPAIEWGGDLYVDGGMLCNYPMFVFDQGINGSRKPSPDTFGLGLGNKNDVPDPETTCPPEIKSLTGYITVLLDLLIDKSNEQHVKQLDWGRTIYIPTGTVSAMDFGLSDTVIQELQDNGYKAVMESSLLK